MILLALAALAADHRLAAAWSVGSEITDVAVSGDGALVAANDPAAGVLVIVDTGTWEGTTVSACAGARGLAVSGDAVDGWIFWTGCEDGTLVGVPVDAESGEPAAQSEHLVLDGGGGAVLAVESDDTYLWAVIEDLDGGNPEVTAIDPETGAVGDAFGDALPTALGAANVVDTVLLSGAKLLVIAHGGDELTKVDLGSGSPTLVQEGLSPDVVDIVGIEATSEVWGAGAEGQILELATGGNDLVLGQTLADDLDGIGVDEAELLFWASGSAGTTVYAYASGAIGEELATVPDAANLGEIVASGGYAFGGGTDGTLTLLTNRPFVSITAAPDSGLVAGETVTLTITTDTAGELDVQSDAGEDLDGDASTLAAGTPTSLTLTVDEGWAEGANRVWAYVTDDDDLRGRAAVVLTVDNPPTRPSLSADDVGYGENRIVVQIDGIDDEDLEGYVVYVSPEPFTAEDYPVGGPEDFAAEDDPALPHQVDAAPGEDVEVDLYGLENDVTYYVAVRSVDASQESAMSDIIAVTPQKTWSAAELAGEDGGFCGTVSPGAAGLGGLALAGLALLRRRRAVLAAALLAPALLPAVVEAAPLKEYTPRTSNVQIRVGPMTFSDADLGEVFGATGHTGVHFEYGWTRRFVELNAGLGWMRDEGWQVSSTGDASVDADNLTLIPLTVTLTGRLELVEEQILVPFLRIGGDGTVFFENWDVPPDATETISGMKYGWHWAGGFGLLLDDLDKSAASTLEARTGINDTYVVGEYRQTSMPSGDGFDFSRKDITVGLKFDF